MTALFLLGLMRSGTTYFRNVLAANQSIQVLGSELNQFWSTTGGAPAGVVERCPHLGRGDLRGEVTERTRAFFSTQYSRRNSPELVIYRAYRKLRYGNESLIKRGKPYYLLNKSTHLHNKILYAQGIFPSAKFIFIVRDIYSQSHSLDKHLRRIAEGQKLVVRYDGDVRDCWSFRRNGGENAYAFADVPRYWILHNRLALEQLHRLDPSAVHLVRYVDLANDLDLVLSRLEVFLDLALTRHVDRKLVNQTTSSPLHDWQAALGEEKKGIVDDAISRYETEFRQVMASFHGRL